MLMKAHINGQNKSDNIILQPKNDQGRLAPRLVVPL